MAYVTVPKDLTKVKSKVVFGLTKRQLISYTTIQKSYLRSKPNI